MIKIGPLSGISHRFQRKVHLSRARAVINDVPPKGSTQPLLRTLNSGKPVPHLRHPRLLHLTAQPSSSRETTRKKEKGITRKLIQQLPCTPPATTMVPSRICLGAVTLTFMLATHVHGTYHARIMLHMSKCHTDPTVFPFFKNSSM